MGELILRAGNPITQHVQMVFPEGGVRKFTMSGIGIAYKVAAAGVAGSIAKNAINASLAVARKLYGGMPFPGTLFVYTDKVVFEPAFQFLSGLYEGVESVTIPASIIRGVETSTKLLVVSTIDVALMSGDHVRIIATVEGKKIADAIKSIV